ncbi:hypothetical protein C0J52_22147 [Blattella germanica]|nr:hypothetical protein C0J52_22147 [Blattella germanica]
MHWWSHCIQENAISMVILDRISVPSVTEMSPMQGTGVEERVELYCEVVVLPWMTTMVWRKERSRRKVRKRWSRRRTMMTGCLSLRTLKMLMMVMKSFTKKLKK